MRVLLIAPYFFERHRWMISAYKTALQLSKDVDVRVLTTGRPAFEELNPRLQIFRMRDLFMPDPVNYSIVPGLVWNLWKQIRNWRPDVVLVNKHMFFTSLAAPVARLFGQRVIVATDTFPGINWHPRHPVVRLIMRIYAWLIGWPILRSAQRLVVYHEDLVPVARKLGLRPQVIHNGVDLEKLERAQPPIDEIKAPGTIYVAYIGRMESIKGYEDILSAAEDLASDYPNVQFLMIGSYQGKEAWVAQHQTRQIRFLGHRDDIMSWLKIIDIFVLASYSEGLPNALMEAMGAGIACVSSRVGGVKTLITENENGLTFEPGDRTALKDRLVWLFEHPADRHRLGQAAQASIRLGYNWDSIRQQYLELFQQLIKQS